MKLISSQLIPARFSYPELESRQEGWGRLTHLSARGARLLTRFRLVKGERLLLSFDLGGEELIEIVSAVASVDSDPDGYFVAELRFPAEDSRLSIGRVLRDMWNGTSPDSRRRPVPAETRSPDPSPA